MSKNLTKKQWIKIIQFYAKQDIYKATDKYVFITKQSYKKIWNLRKKIKLKAKLVNNIDMQTSKRKPGYGEIKKEMTPISLQLLMN